MPRLKSRQSMIPNGLIYYEPITKKKFREAASFDTLVNAVISHRKGNKSLAGKATDYATVADEVDLFNARVCESMGWTNYIMEGEGGSSPPKFRPPGASAGSAAGANRLVSGALTLAQLFGPSEKPVAKELAEQRAAICVGCPQNDKGDWTRFFTEPAAMMIRKTLGFVKDSGLKTSRDSELNICQGCGCALRLKVHANLEFILKHTDAETMSKLDERCWIKNGDKQ